MEKMTDLISRHAAIDAVNIDNLHRGIVDALQNIISELPAIDPVKHGKWIKDKDVYSLYKCTACNDLCTVVGWSNCIPEEQMYKAFKYCPNCGARMDDHEQTEERYRVAPDAEEKALEDLVITREKRRRIQGMSKDELTRYLVHLYRSGFEDGINTLQEKLAEKVEPELPFEEVSVDWEDVLEVIGQVKGIGPKMLQAIDQKLREAY